MHLTRYAMYRRISAALPSPLTGRILGVSGIDNLRPLLAPSAEVTDIAFPDQDLQNLSFADHEFDCVLSDQVLEHLPDPKRAVDESFRVVKIGGIVVHTTCFHNPVHNYPNDYYRFSLEGLRALCEPHAEIIQCEGWGSRLAYALILFADRIRMMEIPERGLRHWLATHSEPNYAISVWVVARRVR